MRRALLLVAEPQPLALLGGAGQARLGQPPPLDARRIGVTRRLRPGSPARCALGLHKLSATAHRTRRLIAVKRLIHVKADGSRQ
jgi:hypothetical protein